MTTTKAEPPFELNTIFASRDPLALDCIATKISGIDPFDTLYLKRAAEEGIGESDYKKIQVNGSEHHHQNLEAACRNIRFLALKEVP